MKARLAILPLLLLLTAPRGAAQIEKLNAPPDLIVRTNGHAESFSSRPAKEVKEVATVQRSPLFDNAPFLRLRAGDRLVTAQVWANEFKGSDAGFHDSAGHYLKTGDRYLQIFTDDRDGRLNLKIAHACLLFDWDTVTIEHAEVIKALVPRDGELTRQQYEWLCNALARAMPEIRAERFFALKPPAVVDLGPHQHVVFEGIAFNPYRTSVYWYRLLVGPTIFLDLEQTLISGPPRVERWEFEGSPASDPPNSGTLSIPAPEVAAAKKKDYERMMTFANLVKEATAQK